MGLLALLALPVPFLHGLAYAGLLIPLVSSAVALTLLPILLATAGHRLDRPRRRIARTPSRYWSGWARGVVRWRWACAAAGVAALAVLILPLSSIHIGLPRTTSLAASGPARAGLDTLLAGHVPPGVLTPIEVLARGDTRVLTRRLSALPGVYDAVAPSSPDYRAARHRLDHCAPGSEGRPARRAAHGRGSPQRDGQRPGSARGRRRRHRDHRLAGLGHTGRLVTSAALILGLAFLAMSSAPATAVKILATGLGAGILIDATIIRCLLLPALVALFGRCNWWLPARPARPHRHLPAHVPAPQKPAGS